MYHTFEVNGYRCLNKLTLTDLGRVNLITGRNNVGKTALLEALFLHCDAYNSASTLDINAFRDAEWAQAILERWFDPRWDSLFSDFDTSKAIELVVLSVLQLLEPQLSRLTVVIESESKTAYRLSTGRGNSP